MLPENYSGSFSIQTSCTILLDDLGNWQDNEILLTKVRHFRKDYLPKSFEETRSIKKLEEKVKTKKDAFRQSALGKTRRLLKKIPTDKNK